MRILWSVNLGITALYSLFSSSLPSGMCAHWVVAEGSAFRHRNFRWCRPSGSLFNMQAPCSVHGLIYLNADEYWHAFNITILKCKLSCSRWIDRGIVLARSSAYSYYFPHCNFINCQPGSRTPRRHLSIHQLSLRKGTRHRAKLPTCMYIQRQNRLPFVAIWEEAC